MWCGILVKSYTKELMSVFLSLCENQSQTPDLDTFLTWVAQIKNNSLIFFMKLMWCHVLPIEIYRKGISRNNHHLTIGAEKRIDNLFYQANHPIYQKICLHRDLRRLTLRSNTLNR